MEAVTCPWEDFGDEPQLGGWWSWFFMEFPVSGSVVLLKKSEDMWWVRPPPLKHSPELKWDGRIWVQDLSGMVRAFKLGRGGVCCCGSKLLFFFWRMKNVSVLVLLPTWVSWRNWKRKWGSMRISKRRYCVRWAVAPLHGVPTFLGMWAVLPKSAATSS